MDQLGIDISKLTFDANLMNDGRPKTKHCENNAAGFLELQTWLKKYTQPALVHACMEGTGKLWEPLAEYLHELGVKVSVVNPLKIKGFALSELRRSKTDKLDAETIARFCRMHNPTPWTPPSANQKAIREMQRYVTAQKLMIAQETNRLKAGILNSRVAWEIEVHIQHLSTRVCRMEEEIARMLKEDEQLREHYENLTSIKGVGGTTAAIFLAEIDPSRFKSARELEVFCGIAPRLRESGTSLKTRSRISKVGSSRIRAALYMPALSAIKSNPVLREFYLRLKADGKPSKVAIVAVMRKLLRLMYAIYKSRKPFDLNHRSEPPKAA